MSDQTKPLIEVAREWVSAHEDVNRAGHRLQNAQSSAHAHGFATVTEAKKYVRGFDDATANRKEVQHG